jgi:hypothetical protein
MTRQNYDPRVTPWQIDDSEFYEIESFDEQVKFLLQYAILAPSSHNTQPWTFHVAPDGVEVLADFSRTLPRVDPANRELFLSIGAAITNLRVAAAHFGFDSTVSYTKAATRPGTIAFVSLLETCEADRDLRELFPAIKLRHTNREPFERDPIDPAVLEKICDVVERFPGTLRLIVQHDKPRVADLIAYADQEQMSQPEYRQELADWVTSAHTTRADGMCADGLGYASAFSGAAEWVLRHVDVGPMQSGRDTDLILGAAALVVVAADDDEISLIAAGEILERLLLTITLQGLNYSFFNSAIEIDALRNRMWTVAGTDRPPQLLLRVGRASATTLPMPRRSVDEVVV